MIEWDDSILVGIPTVDEDHKRILDHINQFIAVVDSHSNVSEIHSSFRNMQACIYRHLGDEEEMLSSVGYDGTDDHAAVHEALTDRLDDIWDGMLSNPDFRPSEAAQIWLESWLFQHVKTEDFLYRDWIVARGLLSEAEDAMKG